MGTRPNFVCFITDQQRADHWGGAGNQVIQTPNLDRLAAPPGTPHCLPGDGDQHEA